MVVAAVTSPIMEAGLSRDDTVNYYDNLLGTSFKLSAKLCRDTSMIMYYAAQIAPFLVQKFAECKSVESLTQSLTNAINNDSASRLLLGKWLREVQTLYKPALLLASVLCTTGNEFTNTELKNVYLPCQEQQQVKEPLVRGEVLCSVFESNDFLKIMNMKTILTGQEVAKELNINPGKILGEVIGALIDWQIVHGKETREDALHWLHANKATWLKK